VSAPNPALMSDREIVVHDRRRPQWEWAPELTDSEREEMAALRAERDELRSRVDELHVAAQKSHDREQALRNMVRELSTGSWPSRLVAARHARGGK
jgi:uncharacterized coiled-coil DUF342 family protein